MLRVVLSLVAVASTLFVRSAGAAPMGVKLSWSSPDASTTMTVSWVTPSNVPTVIEYGLLAVSEHTLTGMAPTELSGIGWLHEIELTGLRPDSTYHYRVGSAGDFSPEHTFRTAPADQCIPFTFVMLGDARSQTDHGPSPNWPSIQAEAAAAGARFFLNGGDLVREGQDIGQWRAWIEESQMVNPVVPMMPAIGNHDDGPGDGNTANYNRIFALPTNTVTGTEDYFYFVYNNALIFSLSTQTFEDYAAQMNWMRSIAAQHPTKWKIAYFHHPVYTTQTSILIDVGHPPNEKGQNPQYGPAFDEVNMDLVVQSHNHIYERFRPLRYKANDPEQGRVVAAYGNAADQGRLYVVSGGAGSFLDPLIESRFINTADGSEKRSKDHHYIKIAIAGNTLHYAAVRTNAGNSSGGGTLIDSLSISRAGTDPCNVVGDPDADADGYRRSRDCNDNNADINPGVAELCGNNVDEDCSGMADRCPTPPADVDRDGSPAGTDCDDNDPRRNPQEREVQCDNVDNNCDCFEECNTMNPPMRNVCPAQPDAGPPDAVAPDAVVADAVVTAPDASQVAADAAALLDGSAGADASVAQLDAEPALADAVAAASDAGAGSSVDAAADVPVAGEGCGCATSTPGARSSSSLSALLVLLAVWSLRRRARVSAGPITSFVRTVGSHRRSVA